MVIETTDGKLVSGEISPSIADALLEKRPVDDETCAQLQRLGLLA